MGCSLNVITVISGWLSFFRILKTNSLSKTLFWATEDKFRNCLSDGDEENYDKTRPSCSTRFLQPTLRK